MEKDVKTQSAFVRPFHFSFFHGSLGFSDTPIILDGETLSLHVPKRGSVKIGVFESPNKLTIIQKIGRAIKEEPACPKPEGPPPSLTQERYWIWSACESEK